MYSSRAETDSIHRSGTGMPRLVLAEASLNQVELARACLDRGDHFQQQMDWLQSPPYRFLNVLSDEAVQLSFSLVLQSADRCLRSLTREVPELREFSGRISHLLQQTEGYAQAEAIRHDIRRGRADGLWSILDEVAESSVWLFEKHIENYIVAELFELDERPDQVRLGLRPEEIGFVPSPYRVIRAWASRWVGEAPHVVDVGAGDGRSGLLAKLALEAPRGTLIECQRALATKAQRLVQMFSPGVITVAEGRANGSSHAVAEAYRSGDIFYFYRPFQPEILDEVLQKIEESAGSRPISVVTFLYESSEIPKRRNWISPVRLPGAPPQLYVHCANGAERFWR